MIWKQLYLSRLPDGLAITWTWLTVLVRLNMWILDELSFLEPINFIIKCYNRAGGIGYAVCTLKFLGSRRDHDLLPLKDFIVCRTWPSVDREPRHIGLTINSKQSILQALKQQSAGNGSNEK